MGEILRVIAPRNPGELRPYVRNARKHSKRQMQQIAASIRQFGFVNPVLIDEADQIIAGHGRVETAKILSLDSVPTLRIEHMSEAQSAPISLPITVSPSSPAGTMTCFASNSA